MCLTILPSSGGSVNIQCLTPTDTYPVATKGCFINLQGHIADPDGIYIYNGDSWIIWKTLTVTP